MRVMALVGIFCLIVLAGTAQGHRTPYGELWAGTTLTLRAYAVSSTGSFLALSNESFVSVGQVVRWRMEYESSPYLTVTSNEGWFTLKLINRGNGVDWLNLSRLVWEGPETSPWQINLFLQNGSEGVFSNGSSVEGDTPPFAPGEMGRLFIRLRPPSDRNTDGVFLSLLGISGVDPKTRSSRDFVAGAEAAVGVATSTTTWTNYPLITAPQLVDDRLWWMAASGTDRRVFFTLQPLRERGTFSSNVQAGAKLINCSPTGASTVIGDRWYLTDASGRIAYFDLSLLSQTGNLAPNWVPLPTGTFVDTTKPLVSDGVLLFFIDTLNRLACYHPQTGTTLFSPNMMFEVYINLYALPNRWVVATLSNGRFQLIRNGTFLDYYAIPGAGSAPIVGFDLAPDNDILLVGAGSYIGCLNLNNRQWLWVRNLGVPLASPPAYDSKHQACFVLTTDGRLHAHLLYSGDPLPFYPQLITEGTVERAVITVARLTTRKVSYVYLALQKADGTREVRMVTSFNPFNRFGNTSIPQSAVLGDFWIQTGDSANDFLIAWCWNGAGGNRGGFYAYRLR